MPRANISMTPEEVHQLAQEVSDAADDLKLAAIEFREAIGDRRDVVCSLAQRQGVLSGLMRIKKLTAELRKKIASDKFEYLPVFAAQAVLASKNLPPFISRAVPPSAPPNGTLTAEKPQKTTAKRRSSK